MKIEIFSILLRTGIFCVYVCAANTHIHYISIRLEERRIVELRSKLPTDRLLQVMPTGKGRELTQTTEGSGCACTVPRPPCLSKVIQANTPAEGIVAQACHANRERLKYSVSFSEQGAKPSQLRKELT